MQVAQLRSCYETDCRFFRDDPRPSRIRWFFVPEDTPYLPFGTIFDSNEWLDVPEGDIELGEVPGAVRTWVDGSAPYPVLGLQPCGTADQFASGDALPPSPPVQLNQYGGILCCQIPPDPFLHNACVNCPNGAYSVYWLRSQGQTRPDSWLDQMAISRFRIWAPVPGEVRLSPSLIGRAARHKDDGLSHNAARQSPLACSLNRPLRLTRSIPSRGRGTADPVSRCRSTPLASFTGAARQCSSNPVFRLALSRLAPPPPFHSPLFLIMLSRPLALGRHATLTCCGR